MQAIEEYRKRPDAAVDEPAQIGPITKTKVHGRPFGEWRLADITREALEGFQRQRPLRREAASRWMDDGTALGTIQRCLGHHNISQTSTYLGASLGDDEAEMRRLDERRAARKAI